MPKIPVLEIIGNTYRFVFSNFGAIFGLTWLPALLLEASDFLLKQIETPNQLFTTRVAISVVEPLVFCLCYSIMAVGVARFVMNPSLNKSVTHFAGGSAEWRMFRSTVTLAISITLITVLTLLSFLIVVLIAPVVVDFEAKMPAGPEREPLFWLIIACLSVSVIGGLMFAAVRYWFFLPIAAIMAPDQWLSRSYDFSSGYFWEILAIILGVALPFLGLTGGWLGLETVVAWMSGTLDFPRSLDELGEIFSDVKAQEQDAQSLGWSIVLSLVGILATIFTLGLNATAAVLVYRFLTQNGESFSDGKTANPKPTN